MAVRQQQRRGTAAQWTAANPILSAAEIGFEIDTNKFKIGDGTNRWANLVYFTADAAAALNDLIDGAPDLLNTLNELAAAIGDDANFVTTMTTNLAAKAPLASPTFTGTVSGVTKSMVGLGNVDNTSDANKPVSTATQAALDLKANSADITELSQDAVNSALTAGSGITKTYNDSANTITVAVDSTIATKTYADGKASDAQAAAISAAATDATTKANAAKTYADGLISTEVTNRNSAITSAVAGVVGAAPAALDTLKELADALTADESTASTLATLVGTKASSSQVATDIATEATARNSAIATAKSEAISTASSDATSKANAAQTAAATDATTKVAAEAALRVSGDEASVSTAAADATSKVTAEATARNTAIATAKSEAISTAASDATTKANNAKSGAETTAATALASHEADTTNIHGIADTSALATKTYADNAASTAVAAVVNSAPEALNTLKELADALTADESTAASLATLVGTKAPSANPTFTGTVQGITKSMVGLGNVDNTSDANKPVSSATQTALDAKLASATAASTYETISNVALKAPLANPTFTGTVAGITKSMVGLSSVDNTSDVNKPISALTQTALDAKLGSTLAASTYAPIASPTFTGTVAGITKSMVGLGNVDNTTDSAKPISTATQTALDLKAALASPELTGTPTAPTASYSTDSTQLATTAFVKSVLNNIGSLNLVLDGGGVN